MIVVGNMQEMLGEKEREGKGGLDPLEEEEGESIARKKRRARSLSRKAPSKGGPVVHSQPSLMLSSSARSVSSLPFLIPLFSLISSLPPPTLPPFLPLTLPPSLPFHASFLPFLFVLHLTSSSEFFASRSPEQFVLKEGKRMLVGGIFISSNNSLFRTEHVIFFLN
jgi:hypothetical protein